MLGHIGLNRFPEVATDHADALGEGPVWEDRSQELLRVDIARGVVHAWAPESGATRTTRVGGDVSAVILTAGQDVIVARSHQLLRPASDGWAVVACVQPAIAGTRLNDCRCDPQGRIWAGTMSKTRAPGRGALYRLDGDTLIPQITGTTLSNGMGWSPSGETMYFIDSTTQRIDAFDFDGSTGDISSRRPFAEIDRAYGLPDGLAVDADGGIWVALFGGGRLRRFESHGTLTEEIRLPVTNPTCPAFGGRALDTLYVTSARIKLSPAQIAVEPAGAVIALRPGVRGLTANRYAPSALAA